jgi:hypothetical protein
VRRESDEEKSVFLQKVFVIWGDFGDGMGVVMMGAERKKT